MTIITARALQTALDAGRTSMALQPGDIVTPAAAEAAERAGFRFEQAGGGTAPAAAPSAPAPTAPQAPARATYPGVRPIPAVNPAPRPQTLAEAQALGRAGEAAAATVIDTAGIALVEEDGVMDEFAAAAAETAEAMRKDDEPATWITVPEPPAPSTGPSAAPAPPTAPAPPPATPVRRAPPPRALNRPGPLFADPAAALAFAPPLPEAAGGAPDATQPVRRAPLPARLANPAPAETPGTTPPGPPAPAAADAAQPVRRAPLPARLANPAPAETSGTTPSAPAAAPGTSSRPATTPRRPSARRYGAAPAATPEAPVLRSDDVQAAFESGAGALHLRPGQTLTRAAWHRAQVLGLEVYPA